MVTAVVPVPDEFAMNSEWPHVFLILFESSCEPG
jgi:hypothetical protein